MTKKITAKSAELNVIGRKAKPKITIEDFEKEITGRRKKAKTYLHDFNEILKYFIEIDVNIDLIAEYSKLTEKYVNIFPDIKNLLNIFYHMYSSSEQISDLQMTLRSHYISNNSQNEKNIKKIKKYITIEERKLDEAIAKYLEYLVLSTEQKFTDEKSLDNFSKSYVLENSKDFFRVYSHCNTFKEAFMIYIEILSHYLSWEQALNLDGETITEVRIVGGIGKAELKKEATNKLEKLAHFQEKEYINLFSQFEKTLEVYYENKKQLSTSNK